MRRGWKVLLWSMLALTVYLTAESFLPPNSQPLARLGVAMIHGYQATGSKLMQSGGVHCRYEPTCSHYAEDAISHYGTVSGLLRSAGRLWRCSPWGGSGYDPAVEEHSAAYFSAPSAPGAQQETEEQRKQREAQEKQIKEDMEKARKEFDKAMKDLGKEAPKAAAACGASCIIGVIAAVIYFGVKIFVMIWAFKDATARGDSNAVIWPILIFFTSIIGLVIYLAVRPKGDLSPCPACHKQRLASLTKCPLCSVDSGTPPKPA
jgi:putative membrane protein insertion efficiency factor